MVHGTHDPAPADEPPQGRSLPHPSNTPWEAALGTGVAWVAWARDQLPERPRGRGQTTGIILGGSDGSGERMVSGHEPESDLAGLILATSDVFPEHRLRDLAIADVARHVETKLAVRQAEAGVTHTVVVLNNRMCDGLYGCTEAVAAILPRGFSMTVWEPGRSRPTIIEGKAT
ncbi:hypothetical protein C1701_21010 [Actinoalloteichus sp. AHMU CJ021]|nr:hypothetical protein C1701_21010 [Actinoalloteichus sp. AHMU CJ021]